MKIIEMNGFVATLRFWLSASYVFGLVGLLSCSQVAEEEKEKTPADGAVTTDTVSSNTTTKKANRESLTEEEKKYADFFDNGGGVKGVLLAEDSPLPGMVVLGNLEFIRKDEGLGLMKYTMESLPPLGSIAVDMASISPAPVSESLDSNLMICFPPKELNLTIVKGEDGQSTAVATQNDVVDHSSGSGICKYGSVTDCVGLNVDGNGRVKEQPADWDAFCKSNSEYCQRSGNNGNSQCLTGLSLDGNCADKNTNTTKKCFIEGAKNTCDPGTKAEWNAETCNWKCLSDPVVCTRETRKCDEGTKPELVDGKCGCVRDEARIAEYEKSVKPPSPVVNTQPMRGEDGE